MSRTLRLAVGVLALAGCTLGYGNFAGKTCESAADCPTPYVCVVARLGLGSTCELLRAPAVQDGGEAEPAPVDYCRDVKPALDRTCLNNCHGPTTANSSNPTFRLDFYENDGGITQPAGGLVQGAKDKADRIKARAGTPSGGMPPLGSPQPTAEERAAFVNWANQGAPFCAADAGN